MKKRIYLFLVCLVATLTVSADPITREQAQLKAERYLQDKPGSRRLAPITNSRKLAPSYKRVVSPTTTELYYVFNRGENQGFVIVAGDDKIDGVLGYTDNGEFDYENLPCNMRYWLDKHAEYVASLQSASDAQPVMASSHPAIEPMIKTKWNQGDPYNQECPMYFNLGRSVTGCVATAMAQIMYFQREKSVRETQAAMPAYIGRANHETFGQLHVEGIPANQPIDWDNMLETYSSGATAIQKKAVAQLMHYCGVSVYMDYTNSSSGAYSSDVPEALKHYFGYGSAPKYVDASNYNDDTWDALLYRELTQGRPFYISGNDGEGGHAFVGDGYKDGCFHINWGWGGGGPDGYYALNKMLPGSQGIGGNSGGYSQGQGAVINFEPADYSKSTLSIANATVKKICIENWDSDGDGKFTYGEAAAVTDLGDVFKESKITTFNELYYFTGLTALDDDAFNGCSSLTAIKLPRKLKTIGARAFAGCVKLKTFALPDGITAIGEAAFQNCRVLPDLELPLNISAIEAHTFDGCSAIKSVQLPICVQHIGEQAFAGCTKLTAFTVRSVAPQNIELGANVFEGVSLTSATLNVQQGTGNYFRDAAQWCDFGTIYEMRTLAQGNFATLEVKKKFYLYNVGTGYYLTHGEAYGTQAVVADTDTPMRYEFRQSSSMPEGVYYLYSEDTPNDNKILFRTETDGRIGNGVKGCFVDGPTSKLTTSGRPAYWAVKLVEGQENIYTIQTATTSSGYVDGEFLGVQLDHASNEASPTYGIYSDVSYADYMLNCQWMLVPYDGDAELLNTYILQLANLLTIANDKRVDASREQAVYDDFNSTLEDVQKACRRLRDKLGFVNFQEEAMRTVIVSNFDNDGNKEISYAEASSVPTLETFFKGNTTITTLDDLQLFTKMSSVETNAFSGCKNVLDVTLPNSVSTIGVSAFSNCSKLEKVVLSTALERIANSAFSSCRSLKEVYCPVDDPATISLGNNIFNDVKRANAVLYVPYGARERYAQAKEWKEFGEIREMRTLQQPSFLEPAVNTDYYIYNLGMRRYLSCGEAYGTQSVVALTGMVYQLRRSSNMADGVYYLYSDDSPNNNKIFFRTNTDGKVGKDVKACFVDGPSSRLTESGRPAYWNMQPVEGLNNIYTFQVPDNLSTYVAGEYLGTDITHKTDAVNSATRGTYWDIRYTDSPVSCQWAFVDAKQLKANQDFFELTEQLRELLKAAENAEVDATAEQAVYDDFNSTEQQIKDAIISLRDKLHYVAFCDDIAKRQSVFTWDDNEDGEISYEEAAAVSDIGTTFRSLSGLKSLEGLYAFTGISEIPSEAFRSNTALVDIVLPEGVSQIGSSAFSGCSNLKYIALLNPSQVVTANNSGLPSRNLTIFVPASLIEAYQADEVWGKYNILEYTGIPTVIATDATRQYGRTTVHLSFTVAGAPINGEPAIVTDINAATPVGTYPVEITAGTITSSRLQCINGTLTVEPAPITVTAKSYTRNMGEPNPEFEITYSTLRNREKIDEILTQEPKVTCEATIDSPAGEYPIVVSGAEAQNYEFTYVNGTLTILDVVGVNGVHSDTKRDVYYDLSGRRITSPQQRGVYITGSKKIVK